MPTSIGDGDMRLTTRGFTERERERREFAKAALPKLIEKMEDAKFCAHMAVKYAEALQDELDRTAYGRKTGTS